MWIKFKFDKLSAAGAYFIACAKIRDITITRLFIRLFDAISKDQMVASILDDADSLKTKSRGERKFDAKGGNINGS